MRYSELWRKRAFLLTDYSLMQMPALTARILEINASLMRLFPNVCFNKRNGGYDRNELLIDELYRKRYIIERTNAWMDSFRSVLVRHDTTLTSWEAWNYIVFAVLLLRKC